LLDATRQLLAKLRPLGARDHVDVEAFMNVVLANPMRPKPQARAKAGARASASGEDEETDSGTEDDLEHDAEPEF
jgi:hypothetical protein